MAARTGVESPHAVLVLDKQPSCVMQNNAAKGNPSVKNCPEKSGRKPIIVKAGNAQIKYTVVKREDMICSPSRIIRVATEA
jgi:hypothetical protein